MSIILSRFRNLLRIFWVTNLAIACTACFPVKTPITASISGKVISKNTNQPLENVELYYADNRLFSKSNIIKTSATGYFYIPSISFWELKSPIAFVDHFYNRNLIIQTPHYQSTSISVPGPYSPEFGNGKITRTVFLIPTN
jgi:hypothetical protein